MLYSGSKKVVKYDDKEVAENKEQRKGEKLEKRGLENMI